MVPIPICVPLHRTMTSTNREQGSWNPVCTAGNRNEVMAASMRALAVRGRKAGWRNYLPLLAPQRIPDLSVGSLAARFSSQSLFAILSSPWSSKPIPPPRSKKSISRKRRSRRRPTSGLSRRFLTASRTSAAFSSPTLSMSIALGAHGNGTSTATSMSTITAVMAR